MAFKVLILGGTTLGRRIAEQLAEDTRYAPMLSFAGRTASVQRPAVPHRIGGFGGASGLADHLRQRGYDALVDATHAYAAQISANAVAAAAITGVPLLRVEEPAWIATPQDRWTQVRDMPDAARALGSAARRVFLTIGRLEIAAFRAAPQHEYLIRAVDPFEPGLPRARVIAARGPFSVAEERELLAGQAIEVLVTKNAGTQSTYAKIEAARTLGLSVVMVARPQLPAAETVATAREALAWLATRRASRY